MIKAIAKIFFLNRDIKNNMYKTKDKIVKNVFQKIVKDILKLCYLMQKH